jgi:hypothetical protein
MQRLSVTLSAFRLQKSYYKIIIIILYRIERKTVTNPALSGKGHYNIHIYKKSSIKDLLY